MAETLPGYYADIWYGVVAPGKTPPAIVSRLNNEIVRQLQSEHVKAKLEADGSDIVANSPADFATLMRADYQRWAAVIKTAGVRAED